MIMITIKLHHSVISNIRHPKRFSILVIASALLLSLALFVAMPISGLTLSLQSQSSSVPESPGKPWRVYAPHWSTEDGFTATVYIRNVHINQALTTQLSLALNHRIITLPPTPANFQLREE
jgi:hypothetical protein